VFAESDAPTPDGPELQQLQGMFDAPAYVRRGRRVQAAFEELLDRCRRQRHEWLGMVRTRPGLLRALAGEWEALARYLADADDLDGLRRLEQELTPQLRVPVEPTTSARALRGALRELCESMERFNGRWAAFLADLDLSTVNELREGYNRYYLLEKECASRSVRVARLGFHPLPPLTREEVAELLPPLAVPRGKVAAS
jgi:hypothetical protein